MSNPTSSQCSVQGGFPFVFYAADGTTPVNGTADAQTGLCTFPDANCNLDLPVHRCCVATPESKKTGSTYMFLAFIIVFIPKFYSIYKKSRLPPEARRAFDAREKERIPSWVPGGRATRLFSLGLIAWILAQVIVPIYMRSSIQYALNVSNRNALIAAEAFLIPFQSIFQFIEDIVLVRVNYALGAGDRDLTNRLVHLGLLSSAAMGVMAGIIATVLGLIPAALSALTNPGGENDASLYPGCDLIPTDEEVRNEVLPYWLVTSWGFCGQYMGLVMSGFLLGAWQLYVVGWLGAISIALTPIIWFVPSIKALWLLGVAQSATFWVFPIISILYLVSPLGLEIREKTGVHFEISMLWSSLRHFLEERTIEDPTPTQEEDSTSDACIADVPQAEDENVEKGNAGEQGGNTGADLSDPLLPIPESSTEEGEDSLSDDEPSTVELLIEGFKIMAMDIGILFASTLGVYLALITDGADGYEIASMQSALPTYGAAYALGLGLILKVIGSQMIAAKKFKDFATFARIVLACAFLLVPIIVGSIVPFHSGLAFDYGGNACEYAKDEQCVDFFTHVFGPNGTGGTYTLPVAFYSFAAVSSVDALYLILRGALLACLDLNFMVWATFLALVAYIPCLVVSMKVFSGHAIAIFVTMYIPQALLCIAFIVRLEFNIRKMLRDEAHLLSIRRRSTVLRGSAGSQTFGYLGGGAEQTLGSHTSVEKYVFPQSSK